MRHACITAILAATAVLAIAAEPVAAKESCGRFSSEAKGKDVHGGHVGRSPRAYTAYVNSYVQRCSPTVVRARHQIYFDTSAFPHGHVFTFSIATRRSDGRWQNYRSKGGARIFTIKGERKIQEVIFYQRRTVPRTRRLTRVHLRHCSCSIGAGNLPIASTLKATYHPFSGPEAGPAE